MTENTNNSKTLGQMIGVQSKSFNIKNDAGATVSLKLNFDFSTASDDSIIKWLVGNRVIRWQNSGKRGLQAKDLKAFDGTTIQAEAAGQKPVDPEKLMKQVVNSGVDIDEMIKKLEAMKQ